MYIALVTSLESTLLIHLQCDPVVSFCKSLFGRRPVITMRSAVACKQTPTRNDPKADAMQMADHA